MPEAKTFMIEGARIIFRNLEGKETQYNTKGERNFGVILEEDDAEQMLHDGWNVKRLKPRELEEEDTGEPERTPWIPVKVSFKNRPPRITMITSTSRTTINEDNVEILDAVDIANVDLICRGYDWTMPSGATGTKAYLQTMFVTINEDELERKYAMVREDD